ncbi:hypothetical protein [Alteromonas gilva]|uniref:Uncharacterized protein n=1 Tax=Alteromonas gilva TaxID=2987522 RepID=A0ABT5KZF0_9ALTE|nr:hypothetical protein [Alteromonas gilva]MDC8829581.1 hypothetical protein [Alteromonas gilva]
MENLFQRQHGEFALIMSEEIVLTNAEGPWNKECIEHFGLVYAKTVYNSGCPRWADIVYLQGESLLVPEAESDLRVRISRAISAGLAKVIYVTAKSTVATAAKMQLQRLYGGLDVEMTFADSVEAAITIASNDGFKVDEQAVIRFFSQPLGRT